MKKWNIDANCVNEYFIGKFMFEKCCIFRKCYYGIK